MLGQGRVPAHVRRRLEAGYIPKEHAEQFKALIIDLEQQVVDLIEERDGLRRDLEVAVDEAARWKKQALTTLEQLNRERQQWRAPETRDIWEIDTGQLETGTFTSVTVDHS